MEDKNLKGNIGEDFVNQIAYKSLLKYWCYPNPIDEKGDKKEICDLLVLFKNICIIISVKNYNFDGNYERYNRKTVEKAVKQIFGAERKLFNHYKNICLKHPDREIEIFDKNKYNSIFRIVVNLGECVEKYNPAIISENDKFVTIFNKDTFELLLDELDTISDFTKYLIQREIFVRTYDEMHWLNNEKDIFALYLKNGKTLISENPDISKSGMIIVDIDGEWDRFCEEYKTHIIKRKTANRGSYLFDKVLEKQLTKVTNGNLLAQEFLSLDRFERRMFSDQFSKFLSLYDKEKIDTEAFRYFEFDDYGVVFFYYSPDYVNSYFPGHGLQTAMIGHALNTNYSRRRMLGVGVTSEMEQIIFKFIDFTTPIENAVLEQAQQTMKELGWFTNLQFRHHSESEFPMYERKF
ncbi:hypothetical protein [Spirosoma flavum]|uniref:NERD domain-containing protein n=1 Tax=Spirosoma flavum TaxID=2048557 RepID=A0ABW6ATL5_9BACT